MLIVLRGNSASGKSSTARALRERFGYGMAWVEQDYVRRILLRERDVPGGHNIGLLQLNVEYALAAGYQVILEGILDAGRYGAVLAELHAVHGGLWYSFDLPFEETVRRHATRELSSVVTEAHLRSWFRPRDLLPFVQERVIPPGQSLEETVAGVWADAGLSSRPFTP